METLDLNSLAGLARAGDRKAYEALLKSSARLLRGYLMSRVYGSERSIIEDIVQETLLAVHTRFQTYNPANPFIPWLKVVAQHKLVDHWRRMKIRTAISLDDFGDSIAEVGANGAEAINTAITLEKLLDPLPEKQQRIIRLAKIEGQSMEDIAQEMGLGLSDVKVTLHRALKALTQAAVAAGEG